MTAQFQFFQSLPHKKADFVKKKPIELGVVSVFIFHQKIHLSRKKMFQQANMFQLGGHIFECTISTKFELEPTWPLLIQ